MYELQYFYNEKIVRTFNLTPESEVKTIGREKNCHYTLTEDHLIQPLHIMIRYNVDHFEVCPVISCKINNQELPLSRWTLIPYNVKFYLTEHSALLIKSDKEENITYQDTIIFNKPQEEQIYTPIIEPPPPPSINELEFQNVSSIGEKLLQKKEQVKIPTKEDLELILNEDDEEEDEYEIEQLISKISEGKDKKVKIQEDITGKTIDERYYIERKIAAGAMGEVYLALDKELRRKVALKIMLYSEFDEKKIKRFFREAKAIGKLHHPNIVQIHDIGEYKGRPYFIMDYLEGKNLSQKIKGEKISPREALQWIKDIASALECAHNNGIIHRDIKPSNIIITEKGAILTDFGIAKDISSQSQQSQLTLDGETLGTPAYMPPEQILGQLEKINPTTDIYSLGAVLYELLTKKPPFEGTSMEIFKKVCEDDPIPIRHYNPNIHRDVIIITMKSMAKEQKYRYQSARELLEDIERYLEGEPIRGKLPPLYIRIYKKIKKNKTLSSTLIICSLLIIYIIGLEIYKSYKIKLLKEEKIKTLFMKVFKLYKNSKDIQTLLKANLLCNKILILSPHNKKILKAKLKITLKIADTFFKENKLDFAQAFYYISYQSKYLQKDIEKYILEKLREIENKKKEKIEKEIKKIQRIIEELKEKRNIDTIKKAVFNILKFYEDIPIFRKKFRFDINTDKVVSKVFYIANRCKSVIEEILENIRNKGILNFKEIDKNINKIVNLPQLDYIEKMIIVLIPYMKNKKLTDYIIEKGLESKYSTIRIFSAKFLGLTNFTYSIQYLGRRIRYEKNPEVIKSCVYSLLMLEGGEEYLLKSLELGNIPLESLKFAGKIGLKPLYSYMKKNLKEYKRCIPIFKEIGKSSISFIIDKIKTTSNNKEKEIYIEILGALNKDKRIFNFLNNLLLKTSSLEIKRKILEILNNKYWSYFNRERNIFKKYLNEKDNKIQLICLDALSKLKDISIIEKLLKNIYSKNEEVKNLSFNILLNLAKYKKEQVTKILLKLLETEKKLDINIKLKIIELLSILKEEKIKKYILILLKKYKYDLNIKKSIFKSLKNLGKYGLKKLYYYFKKGNKKVKLTILEIIKDIKWEELNKSEMKYIKKIYLLGLKNKSEKLLSIIEQTFIKKDYKKIMKFFNYIIEKEIKKYKKKGILKINKNLLKEIGHIITLVGEKAINEIIERFKKSKTIEEMDILGEILKGSKKKYLFPPLFKILETSSIDKNININNEETLINLKNKIIEIISNFPDKETILKLIDLLKFPDIKEKVKIALGFIEDYRISSLLIERFKKSTEYEYKKDILDVLKKLKDLDINVMFLAFNLLSDKRLNNEAAAILIKFKNKEIFYSELIKSLKDNKKIEGIKKIFKSYIPAQKIIEEILENRKVDKEAKINILNILKEKIKNKKIANYFIKIALNKSSDFHIRKICTKRLLNLNKRELDIIIKIFINSLQKESDTSFIRSFIEKYIRRVFPLIIRKIKKSSKNREILVDILNKTSISFTSIKRLGIHQLKECINYLKLTLKRVSEYKNKINNLINKYSKILEKLKKKR